jgi:hypothetical protein
MRNQEETEALGCTASSAENEKRRETIRFSQRLTDGFHNPSCVLLWIKEFTHPYWLSFCFSVKIQTVIYHMLCFDRKNERTAMRHPPQSKQFIFLSWSSEKENRHRGTGLHSGANVISSSSFL